MSRPWCVGCLFGALVWPGGLSGQMVAERSEVGRLVDSVRVELHRGRVDRARSLARRALREAPGDPDAWLAMGRVELATHAGRFRALKLFRRAADRRPDDPEPWYWIGRVGVELLGDDGEAIARPGLERALAIDPEYRYAWDFWTRLYRDGADRDRMVDLLRPHATRPVVRARIAGLWVEGGRTSLRRRTSVSPNISDAERRPESAIGSATRCRSTTGSPGIEHSPTSTRSVRRSRPRDAIGSTGSMTAV